MRRRGALLLLLTALAGAAEARPADSLAEEPQREPLRVETTEKVKVRLVQLDVSPSGDSAAIEALSREKIELWVAGKEVKELALDKTCLQATGGEEEKAAVRRVPVAYLFFFDLVQMTTSGRQRAVEVARDLVPVLIRDGARGMILANARSLVVVQDLTADPEVLLEGLRRVGALEVGLSPLPDKEAQQEEWLRSEARQEEESWRARVALAGQAIARTRASGLAKEEIERAVIGGITVGALTRLRETARSYQREEGTRAEMSLQRLSFSLARFADSPGRKSVFYFADTLRTNAGEHYFRTLQDVAPRFATSAGTLDPHWSGRHGQPFGLQALLDLAVNEAAWRGVRFYTIEAQGLADGSRRVGDAQSTLSALALETGGRAFLNGAEAARIAERIQEDLRCLALVSFDPKGFRQDEPLRVHLLVRDKKIRAHTRGRIVIPSESTRASSEILSKALRAQSEEPSPRLAASLIPIGYRDGRLRALAQVAALGSEGSRSGWDLGATLISGGGVRGTFSGRVDVSDPRVPVVLEKEVSLAPGRFELVAVARDNETEEDLSRWLDGEWSAPEGDGMSVSPIAVVQASPGGFSRGGRTRTAGSLAFSEGVSLRSEVPTAVIALVCAGPERKGRLRVATRLVGEEVTEFPVVELEARHEGEPCAQIRDTVPAGALGSGHYRYELVVLEGEQQLARAERTFHAADVPRR